jgi:hypothetical protein
VEEFEIHQVPVGASAQATVLEVVAHAVVSVAVGTVREVAFVPAAGAAAQATVLVVVAHAVVHMEALSISHADVMNRQSPSTCSA